MRLKDLELKNIGPFDYGKITFIDEDKELEKPPVIIITGENGTGKSIILDSIRTLFYGVFENIEREIIRDSDFLISANIFLEEKNINLMINSRDRRGELQSNDIDFNRIFKSNLITQYPRNFILDYWTSKLSNDRFEVKSIQSIDSARYLDNCLNGVHNNIDVTRAITFFDYLKDSNDEDEKNLGTSIYKILENIISISITDGKLSHVSRIDLKPILDINGRKISLDKLSSGNLYLIQRLLNLLSQVYSICVNNNLKFKDYKDISGLLLIDEAENHLHPKWQKVFLKNILEVFPKLQIIVTTHSPFIVSSIENSRVFVCENNIDYSVIKEETDYYGNLPIEEILRSPLFNTTSFNIEISQLLEKRKSAIKANDIETKEKIETLLLELNPEYFNYLKIDTIIKDLSK